MHCELRACVPERARSYPLAMMEVDGTRGLRVEVMKEVDEAENMGGLEVVRYFTCVVS